jgi:hypothetical protein
MRLFRSLGSLFGRGRRYKDLSASINEHLAEKIDELMETGLSREEATYAARRQFGNATRIEEQSREVWQWARVESILADGRFAVRQLRKAPGFAAAAVIVLALGVAASVSIFAFVNAALLKPLPYRDPARLVAVFENTAACAECSLSSASHR